MTGFGGGAYHTDGSESLDGGFPIGTYAESKAKYDGMTDSELRSYNMLADDKLTCMDYAYYVLNYLYNPNSNYNHDFEIFDTLVLKRTGADSYGFYANYDTSLPTAENVRQNYGDNGIVYDVASGKIYNNQAGAETKFGSAGQTPAGVAYTEAGYNGFFPYDDAILTAAGWSNSGSRDDQGIGTLRGRGSAYRPNYGRYYYNTYTKDGKTAAVTLNNVPNYDDSPDDASIAAPISHGTRNYAYTMKASGKFLYDESKDLYFTFTGDDVVLYIAGQKVIEGKNEI